MKIVLSIFFTLFAIQFIMFVIFKTKINKIRKYNDLYLRVLKFSYMYYNLLEKGEFKKFPLTSKILKTTVETTEVLGNVNSFKKISTVRIARGNDREIHKELIRFLKEKEKHSNELAELFKESSLIRKELLKQTNYKLYLEIKCQEKIMKMLFLATIILTVFGKKNKIEHYKKKEEQKQEEFIKEIHLEDLKTCTC